MSLPESLGAFLAQSRNLILAGNRAGGRPHLTPNWFCWDGERFYVSTTRGRVKYALFRRDPRAQLLIDDPAGPRAVLIPATVEVREDLAAELPRFQAIRDKYGHEAAGCRRSPGVADRRGAGAARYHPRRSAIDLDLLGLRC